MKAVILDRDGVINEDSDDYIRTASEWQAIPGSLEAIADLHKAGFSIYVATNQSGLARQYFDEGALNAMHNKMHAQLAEHGGRIADIAYCPHGPDEGCGCRKPKTGLLRQLQERAGRSFKGCYLIGDKLSDVKLAIDGGCIPLLVRTGKGAQTERKLTNEDVMVFDHLAAASAFILTESSSS